jgi:periplasmic divalent cation tolerance protein
MSPQPIAPTDDGGAETLLVLTNLPDRESAMKLARGLIEGRLAACVNVLSGCASVYRWQGVTEEAQEVPVLIKTRAGRYPDLEVAIRGLHPYELPEIIAVPVVRGLPGYLQWVADETAVLPG